MARVDCNDLLGADFEFILAHELILNDAAVLNPALERLGAASLPQQTDPEISGQPKEFRCLVQGHADCLCAPPPSEGDEELWELVGDPGRKNGERLLRSLVSKTPEWRDQACRGRLAASADALGSSAGARFAAAIRSGHVANLRKSMLLSVCRAWCYKSDVWRRRGSGKEAQSVQERQPSQDLAIVAQGSAQSDEWNEPARRRRKTAAAAATDPALGSPWQCLNRAAPLNPGAITSARAPLVALVLESCGMFAAAFSLQSEIIPLIASERLPTLVQEHKGYLAVVNALGQAAADARAASVSMLQPFSGNARQEALQCVGGRPGPLEAYWWTLAEILEYRASSGPPPPSAPAAAGKDGSAAGSAGDTTATHHGRSALWGPEYWRKKHFAKNAGLRFVVSMQSLLAQARLGSLGEYWQAIVVLCDLVDLFNGNCRAIFEGGLADLMAASNQTSESSRFEEETQDMGGMSGGPCAGESCADNSSTLRDTRHMHHEPKEEPSGGAQSCEAVHCKMTAALMASSTK